MADRGLQTTSVPSARAGQQTDPAARREALSGLISGGFLMAIIAVALAIIVAAPQYAEPTVAADEVVDVAPSFDPQADEAVVQMAELTAPTSKDPGKLRGYVWPVRGGMVATYYQPHPSGDFEVAGERIHDGLVITWFEGAYVKAAHRGVVVAAGRDWARHTGFDGPLDDVYEQYAKGSTKNSKKPRFPLGVVIDDGNGYYSVYSELKELLVEPGDKVKAGRALGRMSRAEGKQMMRYRLVRMDGAPMRVHDAARKRGYPDYARERIDPLAVLKTDAKRMPSLRRPPPKNPPRLSDY